MTAMANWGFEYRYGLVSPQRKLGVEEIFIIESKRKNQIFGLFTTFISFTDGHFV